ncbi:cytochrome P450 monooxygenase [Annulohypoxylon stygium]|nr:cytochrome P450 monooxygenase [Annulohypoxylon stygium]
MDSHVLVSPTTGIGMIAIVFAIVLLYHLALPKPIPGIPYNEASARNLLGDVPAMRSYMKQNEGSSFITYIMNSMATLNAPLIQVFIRPFSKPLIILADFPEAHDMLVRRKEFDRSPTLGDLVRGLVSDHHIHLPTDVAWKSQRRLIQDLMTPSFLQSVAGPVIHRNVSWMIDLWRAKSEIAGGRPWKAADDINHMALDAVTAFTFGEGFEHSSTKPALDEPVEFPKGQEDEVLQSIRDLIETVGEVQGNPAPALTWAYITRKPKIKRALAIKEGYIRKELEKSVKRLGTSLTGPVESAVDQMLVRESDLAAKDGRSPNYFSRVMMDEIFGFVFAGHETTSTTLCWSLKYLADNPNDQVKLRDALQSSLPIVRLEGRNPTIQEIASSHIPYLDATIEETLRCAGTAPVVDRVALADTELLGHRIPKGMVVTCLVSGASMMSPAFEIEKSRRSATSQAAIKEGRYRAWDPADIAVFKPERWLVGGEFDASAGPQLAFGLGTRGCYGKRLVYLEMRIVLTLLLWNFELLPCPPALSGYLSSLITTNEPKQCYVRLRGILSVNEKVC